MIPEAAVLLRIQHLQQCRRRVALIITAHFIDLIEQHERILDTCLTQSVSQSPRHRSDVGTSMTTDFRFIPHTSEADPDILLIQSPRD